MGFGACALSLPLVYALPAPVRFATRVEQDKERLRLFRFNRFFPAPKRATDKPTGEIQNETTHSKHYQAASEPWPTG